MLERFELCMIRQAREWEAAFREALASGAEVEKVYAEYLMRLRWLQHERLIHLLVLMLTVVVFLFFFGLVMLMPELRLLWALVVMTGGLVAAYMVHYYRLENLVQRWYTFQNEIFGKTFPKD